MPKMMKKAQQMSTMLPIGLREEMRVSTTSFSPGARLMTLWTRRGRQGITSHSRQEVAPLTPESPGIRFLQNRQ
jgi:hypothetical protein